MPPTNSDRFDELADAFESGLGTIKDLFTHREAQLNELGSTMKEVKGQLSRIEKFMEGDGRHPPVPERFLLIETQISSLMKFKDETLDYQKQFGAKKWQIISMFVGCLMSAFFSGLFLIFGVKR